jgi:hypothetical protein
LWLDAAVPARDLLDSLEEDSYWGAENRRRYHAVSGARISKINADDEEIYEYNENSEDDEYFDDTGDDYIDF